MKKFIPLFLIFISAGVFAEDIIITEDMILDEPMIIGDGQHITLVPDGGNRTIMRGSGNIEFPLFWVQGENASLTLGKPDMEYQLTIDGGYLNTPSIKAHAPLITVDGADSKLIMYDKVIIQNNYNISTVPSNKLYQYGGGVLVGTIKGISGHSPEFIMKGGVIRGNINNTQNPFASGGGIFVTNNSTFKKIGGTIYGNTAIDGHANYHGHSIYVALVSNQLQRYRDDTIKENENLTYTGSPTGLGVFGKGEKWHPSNTVLHRTLLLIGLVIAAVGVPLTLIVRKKLKTKQGVITPTALDPQAVLSPREREVFALLLTDRPAKHIAHDLELTDSGVDYHITHIYAKLGVKNRIELIAKYR